MRYPSGPNVLAPADENCDAQHNDSEDPQNGSHCWPDLAFALPRGNHNALIVKYSSWPANRNAIMLRFSASCGPLAVHVVDLARDDVFVDLLDTRVKRSPGEGSRRIL